MIYFIIRINDVEPYVQNCKQCVFETAFADPKYAEIVGCIREIDRIRDSAKEYTDLLIAKHPSIQTIMSKINEASKRIETRHVARTLPETIRLIRDICHNNKNIIIQEIELDMSYHTDPNNENCFHVPREYQIKNTWTFGTEFLEYIFEESLIVIQDQGCELMAIAIKSQNLGMIDYLVNAGVDINYKLQPDSPDDILDGYDDYVELAAVHNFETVKYLLNKGCHYATSALNSYDNPKILEEIIAYINLDEMSLEAKAAIVASCFFNLNALLALEKAGVMITNEMMEIIICCHDDRMDDVLEQYAIEHMISLGLNVKYFHWTYENALVEGNQKVIELFEKNGIFEHDKPASFLGYVATCNLKSLEHLLNQGVDPDEDQEEIRHVFIRSMCDVRFLRLLEPYLKDPDESLFNAVLNETNALYCVAKYEYLVDGICFLIDHGATSYCKLFAILAMRYLEVLHAILERKPEIDIEIDVKAIISAYSTVCHLVKDFLPSFSLAETIIFVNKEENFEATLELILKRKVDLDASRLQLLFQKCLEMLTEHAHYYFVPSASILIRKARFLAKHGYLESAFVDTFIASIGEVNAVNLE